MAKIEALNIPSSVVDSDWEDDTPLNYEIFGGDNKKESEYNSPVEGQKINKANVKNVNIDKIKQRKVKIGRIALFKQSDRIPA